MALMNHHRHDSGTCAVTGKNLPQAQLIPFASLRPEIAQRIEPQLTSPPDVNTQVARETVNAARMDYVREILAQQLGELSHLDEEVLQSLHRHEVLSERPPSASEDDSEPSSFGERVADRIASFGGSWRFILSFGGFLILWIAVNAFVLATRAFDPYPFILLNLILSCLAALQAPVIMMSQNRQESRDRKRAENDYKVNLKAELEIRHLHEKVDFILHQQSTRLLEVQQVQLEIMREVASRRDSP